MPLLVVSDPLRLKQILIHVIGNAIKFTNQGAVRVSGDYQSGAQGSSLRFEVHDTGLGMTDAMASRLFRPFAKADDTYTRPQGGAGLGLCLSRSLARAMGGDVTLASSRPGEGSIFRVEVKVELPTAEEWRLATEQSQPGRPLTGRSVLLVEDLEDNQFLITQFLEKAGARVEVASNGLEGVEKALAGSHDAVLMDVQMPKLDGYQATARLRDAGYKKPIIALTAHALLEEREKCLRNGCNDHLTKPINRQRLVDSLLAAISS